MLWLVISVIPFGIVVVILSFIAGGKPAYELARYWLRMMIASAHWIGSIKVHVEGSENIPAADSSERIILCPKHQSTWETFALPSIMPRHLAFVFKKELLLIPVFGWALGRLDMVHIDRKKRSQAWNKVAEQGRELMDQGVWVIMFPEGTRVDRYEKGNYKTGASRLAVATEASIVPIAVTSGRCWPRRSFKLIPGDIYVSIGAPISAVDRQADELMREVESWIEAEMQRLDPPPTPAAAQGA